LRPLSNLGLNPQNISPIDLVLANKCNVTHYANYHYSKAAWHSGRDVDLNLLDPDNIKLLHQ
jgi:hypothetical protein